MAGKWECPICGSNAYERHGGYPEPAFRIITKEDGTEIKKPIMFRSGQHFMCKGCSVFFNNPNKFTREATNGQPNSLYRR